MVLFVLAVIYVANPSLLLDLGILGIGLWLLVTFSKPKYRVAYVGAFYQFKDLAKPHWPLVRRVSVAVWVFLRSHWRFMILFVAGYLAFAAYCYVLPIIITICAITVVGLPLAVILAISPAPLVWAGLYYSVKHFWGAKPRAALMSLAIVTGFVLLTPLFFNFLLELEVQLQMAGDFGGTLPLGGKAIAVRFDRYSYQSDDQCALDCMQLLRSGNVKRLLVENAADLSQPPDPKTEVPSYRLEKRSVCPAVTVNHTSEAALKAANAAGFCLIVENARLSEADYVLQLRTSGEGYDHIQGLSEALGGNNFVYQMTVWADKGGQFMPTLRKTEIDASRLFPVLTATTTADANYQGGAAFARQHFKRNELTTTDVYDPMPLQVLRDQLQVAQP